MPLFEGKNISPDDALAKGLCPECAVDLRKVNPIAHRKTHWRTMPRDDAQGQEGLRRMQMLDDFIIKNKVRTSNQPKPAKGRATPKPQAAKKAAKE
jgi:hypothetical protein